MPPEIINLLIQLPIVAVFIWYSERINRQFQEYLKEQREQDRGVMKQVAATLERVDTRLEAHDNKLDVAVATMKERTAPTRRSRTTKEG